MPIIMIKIRLAFNKAFKFLDISGAGARADRGGLSILLPACTVSATKAGLFISIAGLL